MQDTSMRLSAVIQRGFLFSREIEKIPVQVKEKPCDIHFVSARWVHNKIQALKTDNIYSGACKWIHENASWPQCICRNRTACLLWISWIRPWSKKSWHLPIRSALNPRVSINIVSGEYWCKMLILTNCRVWAQKKWHFHHPLREGNNILCMKS